MTGLAGIVARGGEAVTSLGGMFPNPVSSYFKGEGDDLDAYLKQNEQDIQQARQKATGQADPGTDWWRLGGYVASPVNLAVAALAPIRAGMSAATMAGRGAVAGAAGGAMQPVTGEPENFWGTKVAQAGIGAATSAVATPALGKLTQAIVPRINALIDRVGGRSAQQSASAQVDQIIAQALKEIGQKTDDLPEMYIKQLRNEVVQSLKNSKRLDPATLMRSRDFRMLDMLPTKGQVTRDPTQFALERNLRGSESVGAPLMERFQSQNRRLSELLDPGRPQTEFAAGDLISSTLKKADEGMRKSVSGMYTSARQQAGKDAAVPLQGLAQDAAQVLDDFRDKVPSAIRARLESYGLFGGTQTKVYSPVEADELLKLINKHVGSDSSTNLALSELRTAVKKSMTEGAVPDVFEPARAAAARRFKLQELIPSLDDAASGRTAPDDFVRKFIVNGKARDVQGMAALLQETNPQAAREARNQLAAVLERAAFGENVAGDKLFSPERFARTLRNIGPEKLKAFFTPQEIEQFSTISRVGSYINSIPTAAPVSSSNSNVPLMNLALNTMPRGSAAVSALASVLSPIQNARAVNNALSNVGPVATPNISPAQAEMLARLLGGGAVGFGALGAAPLQQ
jgi:hypothetical protein